ncbi:MAG: hypothetical protein JWL76_2186 [Thermoleophilia bacterium]|nr:hypothetical protein [Thermoleophilia bacterium]
MGSGIGHTATSSTVVGADVPSATNLAIDAVGAPPNGCQAGAPNITSFGLVLPGTSTITSADCNVVFGSSNDSAMLRVFQTDGHDSAMNRDVFGTQTRLAPQVMSGIATAGADRGWVAGGSLLQATVNGGANWALQTFPGTPILSDVDAATSSEAWLTGDAGYVAHTADGGTNWVLQASGTAQPLNDVSAIDALNVWVAGNANTVLRTTDGGATWATKAPGFGALHVLSVDASSASVAWAVGGGGKISKTTDGGTVWAPQTSGVATGLNSVSVVSATVAWVAGDNGVVLLTTDGGTTWTPRPFGTADRVNKVGALDASTAWIVGDNGLTRKTTDGGATWTSYVTATAPSYLKGLAVIDADTIWTAGNAAYVYRLPSAPMFDYDDDNVAADNNWTEGTGFFGACLETVGGGAAGGAGVAGWTVAGDNLCTTASAAWRPIPTTSGASGAKVAALTPGPGIAATATLRFGLRVASNQAPGLYKAPITFQVIAPNA